MNDINSADNELRDKIRAAWPEYAAHHGRCSLVPPVRDGGNTAAIIDLAVQIAAEHYAPKREAAPDHGWLEFEDGHGHTRSVEDELRPRVFEEPKTGRWERFWGKRR